MDLDTGARHDQPAPADTRAILLPVAERMTRASEPHTAALDVLSG